MERHGRPRSWSETENKSSIRIGIKRLWIARVDNHYLLARGFLDIWFFFSFVNIIFFVPFCLFLKSFRFISIEIVLFFLFFFFSLSLRLTQESLVNNASTWQATTVSWKKIFSNARHFLMGEEAPSSHFYFFLFFFVYILFIAQEAKLLLEIIWQLMDLDRNGAVKACYSSNRNTLLNMLNKYVVLPRLRLWKNQLITLAHWTELQFLFLLFIPKDEFVFLEVHQMGFLRQWTIKLGKSTGSF